MNCDKCGNVFTNVDNFVRHFKNLHGYEKTSTYKCPYDICNLVFSSSAVFKRHLKIKHGATAEYRDKVKQETKLCQLSNPSSEEVSDPLEGLNMDMPTTSRFFQHQ